MIESIDYVIKSSNLIKNELFKITFIEEVKKLFNRLGLSDDRYI